MAKYCSYPGCQTERDASRAKCKRLGVRQLSVFKVPKNMVQRWSRAIGECLSHTDFMCELHFSNDSIIKEDRIKMPDGTIEVIPHLRHTLIADAMPIAVHNKVRQLKLRLNKCKQKCAGVEEDALSTAISELPLKQQEIVKACFSAAKVGNPRQRRYTVDWVYECVLMRIKNSKLYDHIRSRNILPLPTKDTLDRYTRRLKSTYGFQNAVFDCLKIKASRMEDAEKCGTVLIDEMSLSEAITFDRRTMQFNGFVDLGRHTSPSQQDMRADHALVFMFQPFRGKWVQVLGAFLSKNSVTSKDLHKLLLECVLLLGKAGFHVDAVTMDGAQWNRGVWSIFGVRDGKFSCEHPCDGTKRLWMMSDFPHLIKCLRNGLMNCQMFWLFSLPVRVAMEVFQSECCALRDSTPTINFCKVVDDLISAMMSRIPREALRPSDTCKHKKAIKDFDEFLRQWQTQWKKPHERFPVSPSTVNGFKITIGSTLELLQYLHEEKNFEYLMTARLNQDALERFFGMMRNACGSNDHPDPALFIQVFRLLCSYSLVKPPKGSNVSGTELLETLMKTEESMAAANSPKQMWLDKIDSIVESQHVLASEEPLVSKSHRDIDTVSIWSQSDHLSCHDYDVTSTRPSVQSSVAGYVARKMCRLTKCSECIGTLKNTIPQERDIVIDEMSQFGGLTYPSDELFSLTSTLEAVVLDVVGKMTVKINTLHQVLDKVSEIKNLQYVGCQAHNEELTKRVINYYLVMRGHFLARSVNENNHARKMKTKDNRKKSKL